VNCGGPAWSADAFEAARRPLEMRDDRAPSNTSVAGSGQGSLERKNDYGYIVI